MVKAGMVFMIAIIFLVIAYWIKMAHKRESIRRGKYEQTYATIDRVIFSDTGNAMYYVLFMKNGNRILAQTDYYSSSTKSLNPGDEVKIGYYFTPRGTPRAIIYDDRVIPVSNFVPSFYKFFAAVGILLLLVAIAMFARAVFF